MNAAKEPSPFVHLTGTVDSPELDAVFHALADTTRRSMLVMLAIRGEATVMELAEPFPISQPAVTRHLKVLERAGLVSRTKDAQRRPATVNVGTIVGALGWLEAYRRVWEANFARLDTLLEEIEGTGATEEGFS